MTNNISIILHADDKLLLDELAGTTETETSSGVIRYHTPVLGRDHRTDSLRAVIRAIQSLEAEDTGYANVGWEDYGWMTWDSEPEGVYSYGL